MPETSPLQLAPPPRTCRYSRDIERHPGALIHRWSWTVRVHNTNPHLPILWATGSALTRRAAHIAARRAIRRHQTWLERIMQSARELRGAVA